MKQEIILELERKLLKEYQDDVSNSREKFAKTEKMLYKAFFDFEIDDKIELDKHPF